MTDESAANLSKAIQELATAISEIPREVSVNPEFNVAPLGDLLVDIRKALSRIANALEKERSPRH